MSPSQSSDSCWTNRSKNGAQREVHDVVGERATDEKFHREVVDAFGVVAFVGLLGADPTLRENVAERAGDCFVPLAQAGGSGMHDVVEEKVALVERVRVPGQIDCTASVLTSQSLDRGHRSR